MKNNITNMILRIKERPGMFLGTPSVTRLRCFLEGYLQAMHDTDTDCWKDEYDEFNEWFARKYNISESILWDRYLLQTIPDESEAFNTFTDEFETFLSRRSDNNKPDPDTVRPIK